MKLQQLRYFVVACQLNSISRAAEHLHMAQPSISTAIRDLEQEFGVPLLLRRYQGFTLTEEGQLFYEMAVNLLRHSDQVAKQMSSLGDNSRPVRLGISPMLASLFLPRLYRSLRSQHPGILLSTEELSAKSLIHDLRDNALDLALLPHYAPLPNTLEVIPLLSTEMAWFAKPEHPLAQNESVSCSQLANEPLVTFQNNFLLQESILQLFERENLSPNILHSTEQLSTIQSLLRSGVATGFLLKELAAMMPDLRAVPLTPPIPVQISLTWPRGGANSRGKEILIHVCQQLFAHPLSPDAAFTSDKFSPS